ncbi:MULTISPECIES: hypothetical protein [Bacillus]|uniref:hypothetical protein n=1 Tax=Bacillus TaxID=1386 RepID=UPI001642D1EA|nr:MULTISPECIES: hypothetical protein [Bacillus]MCA1213013.1 hypothetical protein [Bacillus amyloliquefaciens]MCC8301557.1 hypothetical protein [Bacillus sp. AF12]MDV9080958.1 hypothetical protein [Bacillus sp. ICE1]
MSPIKLFKADLAFGVSMCLFIQKNLKMRSEVYQLYLKGKQAVCCYIISKYRRYDEITPTIN